LRVAALRGISEGQRNRCLHWPQQLAVFDAPSTMAAAESQYTAVPILPFPDAACPMYLHVRQHLPATESEEDAEMRPTSRTLFVAGVGAGYAIAMCAWPRPSHTARLPIRRWRGDSSLAAVGGWRLACSLYHKGCRRCRESGVLSAVPVFRVWCAVAAGHCTWEETRKGAEQRRAGGGARRLEEPELHTAFSFFGPVRLLSRCRLPRVSAVAGVNCSSGRLPAAGRSFSIQSVHVALPCVAGVRTGRWCTCSVVTDA